MGIANRNDESELRVRKSARGILINEKNEVLLQKFKLLNVTDEKKLWITPGGRLEKGEDFSQALIRELKEELGLKDIRVQSPVFKDRVLVHGKKGDFISYEVFFALPVLSPIHFDISGMTELEKNTLYDMKWWSSEELKTLDKKEFTPYKLIDFLESYQHPYI